jgi:peptidoglycan/LPS O-acetylase OafA/YrhL
VAYHLGYVRGGWVGVDVFFVLSGYLITSILMGGDRPPGKLGTFWGHRARRLLPGVLVLLIVLSVYARAGGPGLVSAQLRAPALATLLYAANWQQIVAGHSYFAHYASVSPLQHTWSLAVEEQYYLLWPLLLGGLMVAVGSGRVRRSGDFLLGVTLSLALISAVWMGVAAHLFGPDRAYLGTDSRAWELLLGGAAAMMWPPGGATSRRTTSRRATPHGARWSVLSTAGALGVALGVASAGGPPPWIWDGGLVGIAVCAGLVIVGGVRAPDGVVARLLALGPLRWLGAISYSLYLWHWPVIVLMTTDTTGLSGWQLLLLRLAGMLAASCASFYLVERPIRNADWRALRRRLHLPAFGIASVSLVATAAVILVGSIGLPRAGTAPVSSAEPSSAVRSVPALRLGLAPATPGHPYRVWILGDSVMSDSSLGIVAALQATGQVSVVVNSAFPGWGLTTVHSWRSEVEQVITQSHPQVVIGTWSWDDPEASSDPVAYQALLDSFLGAVLAPGDGVQLAAFVQFPQTGPDNSISSLGQREATWANQVASQDDWNDAARQAVGAFPSHAVYLTTQQLFAPHGRFLTWMRTPKHSWLRARKLDNTHMCPYGAAQFGALLTGELTPILHLAGLKPGWEYGSWTRAPRYDDPPGACPDDQPPAGYRGLAVPNPSAETATAPG